MRETIVLVAALAMFMAAGVGWADDGDLDVDVNATWVSKYIWRGLDKLDDKAAFQPSVNIDLYDTGFSFNTWASFAGSSKGGGTTSTVDAEEWNYTLTYSGSAFDGEAYKTDYALSWVYYDYPDAPTKDTDAQEFNLLIALPDICGFQGLVPSYQIIYGWPARGGGANRETEGFVHVFGLGYELPLQLENPVTFSAAAVYNDGTYGAAVDHDWSHILWGLSTSIHCPMGGVLSPGIYYQTSMDDSVNPEDELWTGLSYTISF